MLKGIDGRAYQVAAWVGVALQAAALMSVLLLERWHGAINLTVFLLGSIAFLSIHDRLPSLLDLLIVAADLANAAGWAGYLFARISFYDRSEEHTYEIKSLMRIAYAVFCLERI